MKFEKRVPNAREVNRATSYCGVKQLVAGLAHNQEVAGSSPVSATIKSHLPTYNGQGGRVKTRGTLQRSA